MKKRGAKDMLWAHRTHVATASLDKLGKAASDKSTEVLQSFTRRS